MADKPAVVSQKHLNTKTKFRLRNETFFVFKFGTKACHLWLAAALIHKIIGDVYIKNF